MKAVTQDRVRREEVCRIDCNIVIGQAVASLSPALRLPPLELVMDAGDFSGKDTAGELGLILPCTVLAVGEHAAGNLDMVKAGDDSDINAAADKEADELPASVVMEAAPGLMRNVPVVEVLLFGDRMRNRVSDHARAVDRCAVKFISFIEYSSVRIAVDPLKDRLPPFVKADKLVLTALETLPVPVDAGICAVMPAASAPAEEPDADDGVSAIILLHNNLLTQRCVVDRAVFPHCPLVNNLPCDPARQGSGHCAVSGAVAVWCIIVANLGNLPIFNPSVNRA